VSEKSWGQPERTRIVGKKASAKDFQEFMLTFFISFLAQLGLRKGGKYLGKGRMKIKRKERETY
jgi:hypothetical protein